MTFEIVVDNIETSPTGLITNKIMVKYLSENDFVDNWQMKLPKYRFDTVKKNINEEEVDLRIVSPLRKKIILSQLPPHLWSREPKVLKDDDGKVIEYLYKDKKYIWWYVKPTNVDNEIRELYEELRFIPDMNKDKVKELLGIIEDNKAGGWLVKRGWKALKNPEYFECILY